VTFEVFPAVLMGIRGDLDLLHVVLKCRLDGTILFSYCFLVLWIGEGMFYVRINVLHIKKKKINHQSKHMLAG